MPRTYNLPLVGVTVVDYVIASCVLAFRSSLNDAHRDWPRFAVSRSTVQLGRIVLIIALVILSLLVFPACLPWVFAIWLAWITVRLRGGQHAHWLLLGAIAIILLKRPAILPGVAFLLVAMCVSAIAGRLFMSRLADHRVRLTLCSALWISFFIMVVDWQRSLHSAHPTSASLNRPVVLLGDSLLAGEPPLPGLAKSLRTLIDLPVVDLSRPGITTTDALAFLPALAELDPQLVVVELGGHDYLRGRTLDETYRNLDEIILSARKNGAEVILMEIPRALVSDPYWGVERHLARKHGLELIPDTPIRTLIFWSPYAPPGMWLPNHRLSDDGLHPNLRGNRYLAEIVARAITRHRAELP